MMTLGSFIGTDAFVSNSALEKVDDCSVDANGLLIDPTSIHNTCTALVQLADSACRLSLVKPPGGVGPDGAAGAGVVVTARARCAQLQFYGP